jgi:hypothetical protein
MLNHTSLKETLQKLPIFELSYEEFVDKKVYSDICFALPYGIKCLLWFTFVDSEFVCISIPMYGNKLIVNDAKIETCCFNKNICYGNGSVCLGIKIKNSNVVVLYDIFYYKNINYDRANYKIKLETLCLLLHNIKNDVVLSNQLTLFLPNSASNVTELYNKTRNISLNMYCYMFVDLYKTGNHSGFKKCLYDKLDKSDKIFIIRPHEDNLFDMYDLYVFNKGNIEYYNKAHINTLKMSYILNKHIYGYKYVDNIDILEESDDEGELLPQYKKDICVKCRYNKYFKLWEPTEIINSNKIATLADIQKITSLYQLKK